MAGTKRTVREAARNFRRPLQIPSILSGVQIPNPVLFLCRKQIVHSLPHIIPWKGKEKRFNSLSLYGKVDCASAPKELKEQS